MSPSKPPTWPPGVACPGGGETCSNRPARLDGSPTRRQNVLRVSPSSHRLDSERDQAPRRFDGPSKEIGAPPFMPDERLRRQIAFLAAQMMYHRTETEYFTAKRKAARQLGVEYRHRPGDLPTNREIRDQIQAM